MQIDLGDMVIGYDEQGEGAPVLLLHGWGASSASFAPVTKRLAEMGFRAVAMDFPGFGESGRAQKSWSLSDYVGVTRAFIREMRLEGCCVVAHSFGGRVAIRLAAQEGEEKIFRRIVLCGSAGVKPKRSLLSRAKVLAYKSGKKLARVRWLNRALRLDARMANAGSADYRALDEDMKKVFVRVINEDLTPFLANIARPTLLIWGENDRDTPLYMARIMEKRMRDAALVVFEGAGHYAYLDGFARFMTIILHFFKEE